MQTHELVARLHAFAADRKAKHQMLSDRINAARQQANQLEAAVEAASKLMSDVWRVYIDARTAVAKTLVGSANRVIGTVFGPHDAELGFRETKSGDTIGMEFFLKDKRTGAVRPTSEGFGRGLMEVAALTLRMAMVELLNADKVLVLDEPVPSLDADRQAALCDLMSRFCQDHGYQMVVVTHSFEFADAAGTVLMRTSGKSNE